MDSNWLEAWRNEAPAKADTAEAVRRRLFGDYDPWEDADVRLDYPTEAGPQTLEAYERSQQVKRTLFGARPADG